MSIKIMEIKNFNLAHKLKIPQIFEVTFLIKNLSIHKKPVKNLPHKLDPGCNINKPEIILDNFFLKY
jgi:hypothetical protein